MSKYSGKYDFADWIETHGVENIDKVNVYVGDNKVKVHEYRDIIPYLAHIIVFAGSAKGGQATVKLSVDSYVDRYEREMLQYAMDDLLRIYRKCKRQKIEFCAEDAVNQISWHEKDVAMELAKRIEQSGKKANFDGLHIKVCEFYRKHLAKEMMRHGLNPVDYGLDRFVKV